jgi:hypothetical protein
MVDVNCFENKCGTHCVNEHIFIMFLHKFICINKYGIVKSLDDHQLQIEFINSISFAFFVVV